MVAGDPIVKRPGRTTIPAILAGIPPQPQVDPDRWIGFAIGEVGTADGIIQMRRVISIQPEAERQSLMNIVEDSPRIVEHDTIRGAAGDSVLNAELALKLGYIL